MTGFVPSEARGSARARLCLATDSLEPSGVGEHMLVLAAELKAGYDIVVACPSSAGGRSLLDRAAQLGLGIKLLADEEGTADWMARMGFALLHIHAGIGWEGHGLAAAGRAAAIPALVRTEHLPHLITDLAQRDEHAAGLRLVDRTICVSAAAARSFRAAGLDGSIVTIRNGLHHRPATRSREAVRAALGLGLETPVLLLAARFTAQKNHAALIGALPRLLDRRTDLVLLLAGTGPLEAALRTSAAEAGVAHAVRFLGRREDVPDLLAAADLMVLPSRFEGLPLALIEAAAAGVPVVATAVGGSDEIVLDGVSGRLVPPGDTVELAEAIDAILDDPAVAADYAAAGRDRFLRSFTARRMATETAALYTELGFAPGAEGMAGMSDDGNGRTRIGFIGAGGIAHRHLGVLEQFADVEIAAFADPDEGRANGAAERFGARSFRDPEAMLAEVALDALYICVPPFAHGAPERAALAKNIPFFVEKPLALDPETAEPLARAIAAAGLITAVGYHWRYLDTVDEARALLADNPARLLSGYWLDSTPPPPWWWKQDQSGGQFNEQTTHIVDLARYLVGDVTQVYGLAGHTPRDDFPGLDVPTASTASLRFASGAVGNVASTCLLRWNHRVGLHIFADGLAMEITDHDLMVDVGRGRPVRHAEGDPVWREDRDFIDAVRGGPNHIRCPYPEALATLRITDAIARSAATGRAIDLSGTDHV